MILLPLLPALLGIGAGQAESARVRVTYIENEFVMRVPVRPPPPRQAVQWKEKKGPKCLRLDEIRGAQLSGTDQLDFLLANRKRIRARLDGNCPALAFYGGFYLNSPDQRICVRRDVVRARMGGSCAITAFRRLVKP